MTNIERVHELREIVEMYTRSFMTVSRYMEYCRHNCSKNMELMFEFDSEKKEISNKLNSLNLVDLFNPDE